MAQNFLYMFEFVVDDLLITRPNYCAPEEYPTCCEISFRSSVFVSVCDREFGACVDTSAPKYGKCCLFSLESPVVEKDRLLIHVYKKKTEKCKFLIGATDIPIKPLFDKVTESFNIENPNWRQELAKHSACMQDPKAPSKTAVVDNDCDEEGGARRERMCPTSELTKRLLPLFNMKKMQTGNIVLIMRLVCNGPTIVSTFPFSKICSTPCGKKPKSSPSCPICPSSVSKNNQNTDGAPSMPDPCKKLGTKKPPCRRYFACNADKSCPCDECEDDCDRECPAGCNKNKKKSRSCSSKRPEQSDPCKKPDSEKGDLCQRYFSNNQDKTFCCNDTLDECDADDDEDECEEEEDSCEQIQPCFIVPNKPEPGPEAYEEFEACLNGSGLTIRVLKDTHQVSSVSDGMNNSLEESGSECEHTGKENQNSQCESLCELLRKSTFARNHVKRQTAGHIINNPKIPKIRANIKYSGQDSCGSDTGNYHVPFSKIKQACEGQDGKLDHYRKQTNFCGDCGPIEPPKPALDSCNCCLQVEPQDIKNALKGINADTKKKGIEVCYKTCDDSNSDVFLVKLGSKKHCQKKKNSIEIELKTPKQPIIMTVQKATTSTQVNEAELDAAMSAGAGNKGNKGKGKGKGKGKKKK